MSLSQNSKQQETLIKATIETDCHDHPDSDTGKMPGIGTYQKSNFIPELPTQPSHRKLNQC